MKATRLIGALCALLLAGTADAGRFGVMEEASTISPPDSSWTYFGRFGVAVDFNYALVSAERYVPDPNAEHGMRHEGAAFLYKQAGVANYTFQQMLGPVETMTDGRRPGLAMKDGVAMTIIGRAHVFHQVNTSTVWNEEPIAQPLDIQGEDIEISVQHIMVSTISSRNETRILRPVNGVWTAVSTLLGSSNGGGSSPPVPPIDIDGISRRAVVFNEEGLNFEPPAAIVYARNADGITWSQNAVLDPGYDPGYEHDVAVNGDTVAITGTRQRGTSIFYTDLATPGAPWHLSPYTLQPPDGYLQPAASSGSALVRGGRFFVQRNFSYDRQAYVLNAFASNDHDGYDADGNNIRIPDAVHSYTHGLQLVARNGASLGRLSDDYAGTIIVNGWTETGGDNTVRVYSPLGQSNRAVEVHDFEASNSLFNNWSPAFSRVKVGNSWVYRQSSVDGTRRSVLYQTSGFGHEFNESIQGEVTLRASTGPNAWVGLLTHYTNDSNYYYVTLRVSGSVELKRMVNGVFTTLAAAPATLTAGRTYRLRLESIGTTHRVYLDDAPVLTARDASLPRDGYVGIITNRAAADYDNVIVSPTPFTTIMTEDFQSFDASNWTTKTGSWSSSSGLYHQTSTSGYGRAVTGALTDDQVLRVRVKPRTFVTPGDWVGVMARYFDDRNYLYVSMAGRGVISLWRRQDGAITQLATKSLPITPGTWYDVRVEVVNEGTRVFVNDQLLLSSNAAPGPDNPDVDWSRGQVGLITRNASADFDDFLAYQP
jgi:hypothetical protein